MKDRQSAYSAEETTNAALEWDENGLPVSSRFDDVYFSKASGIAETRYVFLHHNQLKQRFKTMKPGQSFIIAETGFGTGLNFLCAWQLFDEVAPKDCQLHFISTEKYPLTRKDMVRALRLFPELGRFSAELCECYHAPDNFTEKRQLNLGLANNRVKLSLLIGDVLNTLPGIEENIDAWFLDGFAPAKNPQMWQPSLFQTMATKSANAATYATFTAARMVRDGLNSAGFTINRHPGYGAKREMISGQFLPKQSSTVETSPWFEPQKHKNNEKYAIVIGGGLAGTSAAYALAARGWQVKIIEQHNQLAQEASGNAQGILYAKLSAHNTPLSQFVLDGYRFTLDLLNKLELKDWSPCGVIQLALTDKLIERYSDINRQHPDTLLKYLNKHQLSDIAGLPIESGGLYFPDAGWVSPPAFCEAMANHPNITITTGTEVEQLDQTAEGWQIVSGGETIAKAKTVIIAKGTASNKLPQVQHLPLKAIRGQVSHVIATESSARLSACVCGEGYIAPAHNGYHSMGATFNHKDDSRELSPKDHRKNLGLQAYSFPAMYSAIGEKNALITGGRVGFRTTTPDYLPVIGGVIDYDPFVEQFAPLRRNRKHRFSDVAKHLDGLYITAGHGSRGLLSCPLAGELLAGMINNESLPLDDELLFHLNPTRFLVRDLARNKI